MPPRQGLAAESRLDVLVRALWDRHADMRPIEETDDPFLGESALLDISHLLRG